ncbi:type I DNA topoisomerase [Leptolyngbya ohadii]|uniref:type I DNA topoisomerase n=1 Tax=Leptolyngbya ohadii TaxID=1962290 RepID=UPI0015C5C97F|nr:type I DNA topoisomerase [Leptolyngbya ohadii]
MSKLLIIEAPGKLKKLKAILPDWTIKASGGHIRELAKDKQDALGFQLQGNHVVCQWTPRSPQAKQTIAELRAAVKAADQVILATDEDREGETIGWHLAEELRLKNPLRATYREITSDAVKAAIANPRPLNLDLVHAGLCRSVLDKLVGFKGSPLVWQLNNGAKSVGRVQSATLHLVAELETKIRNFEPQDYWTVFVQYEEGFRAFYHGGVFSPAEAEESDATVPGEGKPDEGDRVTSQAEADRLVQIAQSQPHRVISVEGKTVLKQPPAPFTTSTLQQAASTKLKLNPETTMAVAQKLYEGGYITYMRTDATFLAPPFVEAARGWLEQHDRENLPPQIKQHKSGKNAQEAHEAVRPTDISKTPDGIVRELEGNALGLYTLIWNRTIASLCQPARIQQTRIVTQSGTVQWLAKGQMVVFEGFAKYWRSLGADAELPSIQQGQSLKRTESGSEKKQTQPPSRYSEAQLVQMMERRGIGRPSTFASTIATLKDREYVRVVKSKVEPTDRGMDVDRFLSQAMPTLVDTDFTAEMELQLDLIAEGKLNWEGWLTQWNRTQFEPALSQALRIMPQHAHAHPTSEVSCPSCETPMQQISSTKVRKGFFLKCPTCEDCVMFWNDRSQGWELPKPKAAGKVTSLPCPVCQKPLEEHTYVKEGVEKVMLRCSDDSARQQKNHKEAVYFQSSKGGFWSPKFGTVDYSVTGGS